MSPTPPPIEPSPLWIDAAVSGALGILAGFLRWLMDTNPKSLGATIRHLLAAGITAGFAGLALGSVINSEGLRFAAAGSTGYAGVALWDWAIALAKTAIEKRVK